MVCHYGSSSDGKHSPSMHFWERCGAMFERQPIVCRKDSISLFLIFFCNQRQTLDDYYYYRFREVNNW